METKHAGDHIIKKAIAIKNKCTDITLMLVDEASEISEANVVCDKVVHYSGLRSHISSDNQRQYLIALGPHQPLLNSFP